MKSIENNPEAGWIRGALLGASILAAALFYKYAICANC